MATTAIKVSVVVGSALLVINHGAAIMGRTMTPARWLSGSLTYVVPYLVSIHGQCLRQKGSGEESTQVTRE